MTKVSMALAELAEKGPDSDIVRELVGHVVQRLMSYEVQNLCEAGYGERSEERANSRNGYRDRLWQTRT